MPKQTTAKFGRPFAAPWHLVISGRAPPMGFDRRQVWRAGEPSLDQHLELLQARAIAILEDRHELAIGFSDDLDHAVDIGDGAEQRLFSAFDLPPLALPDAQPGIFAGPATLGVRPEDLVVSREPGSGWPITVGVTEQYGANSYLHCTLGDDLPILVHEPGQSQARNGDVLYIAPRSGHWHLFDADGLAIAQS